MNTDQSLCSSVFLCGFFLERLHEPTLDRAGAELHGIIGYTVLAQSRLEIDFTRDKMRWTRLDFTPPAPQPVGGKSAAAGIEGMAGLMKLASFLMGSRPTPEVTPRGFLGV